MKKFTLAVGVFAVFVLYSLAIRQKSPVLSKPPMLAQTTNTSPSSQSSSSSPSAVGSAQLKDGTYTGSVADAYYGNVEVAAVISSGKLSDVKVLQYPNNHSTSVDINQQALPYLKQEAVQSQSSNVQIISGATFTSQAFMQSLSSALTQAHA